MASTFRQWLKDKWKAAGSKNNRSLQKARCLFEQLEPRTLLSGSNAIDRLDFGNLASEAAHNFEPGFTAEQMPIIGVGSLGQTYREPVGSGLNDPYTSQGLTFTLTVDPNRQNYLSIKLWGGDVDGGQMYLLGAPAWYPPVDYTGGQPAYPGRFFYYTVPIPVSMTSGKTSAQITLNFVSSYDAYGGTGFHYLAQGQLTRPVYGVFSHTDPIFVPDSQDVTGAAPTQTGQVTLDTLSNAEAIAILLSKRQSIYNAGNYYDDLLARQVIVLNGQTWSAPNGAPVEVVGMDISPANANVSLASWMSSNSGASADTWRNDIAVQKPQPGYTAFPDELLSALCATYLLQPFRDANGNVVSGLDHYHDSTIITRIVAALDGSSYSQGSDGGFPTQGGDWCGLTSTARTTGTYAGQTSRHATEHGGGDLQGVDTYSLGWVLISLLNDPTASPILQNYLNQSYDADLSGGSMLRATAYERMLYNHIQYCSSHTGGVESQNMFEMLALYSSYVALEKLQVLYPNSTYVYSGTTAVNYAKMVMGLAPDTLSGINPSPLTQTNYGISAQGLGEAHGALSGGYDGHYGLWITVLAPEMAQLAALDPGLDTTTRNNMIAMSNATTNSYDQFISSLDKISGGADYFTLGQEDFITYRNTQNPNYDAGVFQVNTQYVASDPNGPLHNAYDLRSAYLETQNGIMPNTTAADTSASRLNFLKDYAAYESTIRSLINVNPATLTELPGEPGQPDYAWADVQTGAVAFVNHGERFYMNADWRNYEVNNNTFTSMGPGQVARIHDTTDTIDRAAMIYLPYNSATVQPDGNYSSTSLTGATVVRYGDYLIVLNKSGSSYSAKLPTGIGLAENLITGNTYALGSTVVVAAGQPAIFWLAASNVISSLNPGADIGSVGSAGSDSYANSTYTVSGAGADIGGTTDAFRFVSTSYTGDVSITAMISSQTAGNNTAKAGVMIRDGSAANAAFAAVVRTPGNGILFEWRSAAGGDTAWVAVPTSLTPAWVRLTRSGNSFAAYYSTDGVNWMAIGTPQTVSLSSSALVGLAVSSHNTGALSTAVFNNLWIASGSAPSVANPAAASSNVVTGKTVNLSVLGADNGGESNLTYTWYLMGNPPDQVTYSTNAANAAKNATVTFVTDGVYNFRVIVKDASGFVATSDVTVSVAQTASGLTVWPNTGPVYLAGGASQAFTAFPTDQFGAVMSGVTPTITWSIVSGGVGSINSSGVYTAPVSGSGSATVRATSGSMSATSAVTCLGIFSGSQDIGAPGLAGSASYNSSTGTYTVAGGGTDIWVGDDQFRYVYVPVTGDATIIARVVDSDSDPSMHFSKAGVMFRSSLDSQSAYAYMSVTYAHGFNFQWRLNNGGSPGQSYTDSGGQIGWVKIVRSGNTFTTYYSSSTSTTQPTTWSQTATYAQTIAMGSTVYVGFAVTARNNSALNTSTFSGVTLTTTSTSPIFSNRYDVGSPSPIGTYTESAGVVTMTAGGSDIYSNTDHFQFAYVPITGNVTLTARVVSLVNTNTNAKAGVMIRNSLDSGSPEASTLVTASNGINLDYRTSLGGSSSESKASGYAAPYWVQIVRSGSNFKAYRSSDGSSWTQIGSTGGITITMNSTVLVGLALTSHNDGTATTAVFDNITISGTADVAPTIGTAASASPATVAGTTTNLSVLGADSDGGGESNLTYTWALVRGAPATVSYSANGTNSAKNTTVTFSKAGAYNFTVTIKDTGGLSATGSVTVTVNQTLTSIALSPTTPSVSPLGTLSFTATALDQFGLPITTQPSFAWSIPSGGGTLVPNGSTAGYTAPLTGASATVSATSDSINGSTTVNIVNQSPLLAASSYPNAINAVVGQGTALSVLGVDDAGESNLIYTWSVIGPPPAPVTFGANGNNSAKNTTAMFTKAGTYNLQVTITDAGGSVTTISLSLQVASTIAGRYIFYNNSKFDSAGDSAAIASDKTALLPGQTASFANYTSYNLGINGIIVDIKGLANPGALSAGDFQFQVGNGTGWTAAPDPSSISAPGGGGANGSDRVTFTWDDNAIQNQWLKVTVLADAHTGLAAADVFYFGNAIGESGNSSTDAVVDSADETGSRTHKTGFSAAAIDNHYDYNRDGRVNAADDLIARNNSSGSNPLQLIAAPVGAPLAAGDTLQPLSVTDIAITPPATAETATLQPATVDVVTLPQAALLEDDAVQTPLAPVPLLACPAVQDIASVSLSSAAVQFPGVLHPRDIAGNTILFSPSLNAAASDQWVSTPEHVNQMSRPATSQDRLHDAVFARSLARFSLTEYDGQPDDSSAPADIETYLNDCLPTKSDKSPTYAIDNVFAALRHKKE